MSNAHVVLFCYQITCHWQNTYIAFDMQISWDYFSIILHNTVECHFFEFFFLTTHHFYCHVLTSIGDKLSMWWNFFATIMCWHQSYYDHGLVNFLFKCVHFVVIKCPWSCYVFKLSDWQLVHILLLISRFHEIVFPILYIVVHGLSFLRFFF